MSRRRFLARGGLLVGGGSIAFATGAVTGVGTDRRISIAVVDDDRAFLGLEPLDDEGLDKDSDGELELAGRSETNAIVVAFKIPGEGDGENPKASGVGVDSIYEFQEVLQIENQGTQPIKLKSEYSGNNLKELALVTDNGRLSENPPILKVGESIAVGLYIDTTGAEIGFRDETLVISPNWVGDTP